jgi:phage-related protein
MLRDSRPVVWIKAARKDFEDFPEAAQTDFLRALTIVAEGQTPDIAKPLKGLGSGVLELALRHPAMHSAWCMPCSSGPMSG